MSTALTYPTTLLYIEVIAPEPRLQGDKTPHAMRKRSMRGNGSRGDTRPRGVASAVVRQLHGTWTPLAGTGSWQSTARSRSRPPGCTTPWPSAVLSPTPPPRHHWGTRWYRQSWCSPPTSTWLAQSPVQCQRRRDQQQQCRQVNSPVPLCDGKSNADCSGGLNLSPPLLERDTLVDGSHWQFHV